MVADVPDLLRLVAVPALGWAAWRDVKVRRVPNRVWYPLAALGAALLAWEAWQLGVLAGVDTVQARLFVVRVAVSLGMVVPLSYLIWRLGGFGGADAKAVMALAVLLPTFPTYVLTVGGDVFVVPPAVGRSALGVFSLAILTNAALLSATYPAYLAVRNLLAGNRSRLAFVGKRVPASSVQKRHGSLLETPEGYTRRGLDLDALRMYIRWRGVDLTDLRADPEQYRDAASLPEDPGDPTDGAIVPDGGVEGGRDDPGRSDGATTEDREADDEGVQADARPEQSAQSEQAYDDPWGAAAFLDDVGSAWGTTAADLRGGLEVLTTRDRVWYSPGIPFIVPIFLGLVVGLLYGDLLFSALRALGLG